MERSKRKPCNKPLNNANTPTTESQSPDIADSDSQELYLLLLRPFISKIFASSPDDSPIDADVVTTSFGMYSTKGMKRNALEIVPVLCVSESCHVGYTTPMRLDLLLCLEQLAAKANPPIDFPLGLFTNRDVIVVTQGLYTVMLCHNDLEGAFKAYEHRNNEFPASKIIYATTTSNEDNMINLRRLEATSKHLLTPEPTTVPKLPPELAVDWQRNVLEPIFKRAKKEGVTGREMPNGGCPNE